MIISSEILWQTVDSEFRLTYQHFFTTTEDTPAEAATAKCFDGAVKPQTAPFHI